MSSNFPGPLRSGISRPRSPGLYSFDGPQSPLPRGCRITQRLLKAALAGKPSPYSNDELVALALHCTEQEDAAKKVERQVGKCAAALLLESKIGVRFDALVTGATDRGTWVRILQPPTEGRLVEGFLGKKVGDCISVQLLRTDAERGYIDFKAVH